MRWASVCLSSPARAIVMWGIASPIGVGRRSRALEGCAGRRAAARRSHLPAASPNHHVDEHAQLLADVDRVPHRRPSERQQIVVGRLVAESQ
jgi:hypothetical protein